MELEENYIPGLERMVGEERPLAVGGWERLEENDSVKKQQKNLYFVQSCFIHMDGLVLIHLYQLVMSYSKIHLSNTIQK